MNLTGRPLNLVKPEMTDMVRETIPALASNMQSINTAFWHRGYRARVARIKDGEDPTIKGQPIIGDPNSLICAVATGLHQATGMKVPFLRSIHSKGLNDGSPHNITTQYVDFGSYPRYVNRMDNNIKTDGGWRMVNGLPSGIYEYHWLEADDNYLYGLAFTWQNVLYIVCECQNMNDLKLGFEILDTGGNRCCNAAYETYGGRGYIWAQELTSEWYLAMASEPMNEYQVDSEPITVIYGLDEGKTSVSESPCYVACGADGMGYRGRVVWAISIASTKEGARDLVLNGVQNWATALAAAESWWSNFYQDVDTSIWASSDLLGLKGCLAVQQIAAQASGGFLSAGVPDWYNNFIRDTGWVVNALSGIKNSLARDLLMWFSCAPSPTGTNSYSYDRVAQGGNNTDNAPTFLLAAGAYYRATSDLETMTVLKSFLDNLLVYAQNNYNSSDKHVLALHSHDYWDDYVPEINTSLVKYESMVDVLWIAGLESIALVYQALGDLTRKNFCDNTAAGLRLGLEQYRRSDGGLEYAIKTDNTLYNTVIALPANFYAAWLLDDNDCKAWLRTSSPLLGLRLSTLGNWGLAHSNYTTDHSQKDHVWGPHFGVVAALAAIYFGDLTFLSILEDSFPLGGFPEYVKMGLTYYPYLAWYSHAPSFPWSHASILEALKLLATGGAP